MAMPTLSWGIIKDSTFGDYQVLRITRKADKQVSGIRVGDISSTTWRRSGLVGEWPSEEAAQLALFKANNIKKQHHIGIRDAENALERLREASRREVAATLKGNLTNA